MAPRWQSTSLVARVARSAATAASLAALLAAVATSSLGALLLQRAEDRRLREAAWVLATELGREPLGIDRIRAIVRHEHEETQHASISFAVAASDGVLASGDVPPIRPAVDACATDSTARLRACSVRSPGGLIVTAAAIQALETPLFLLAALAAVAFTGAMTWWWSRPVARAAVAPLSRLRERVAAIDVDRSSRANLGSNEGVTEVDELRTTLAQLIEKLSHALEQAQRFAGNAAHELRTPLTAVRAELDLLADERPLAISAPEGLAAARTKVSELSELVERLLILAAPRSAMEGMPTEIISLRDLIEDVVRALPKSEQARVSLPDRDALVRGDAVLLTTLFANGVSNALKFGQSARVRLSSTEAKAIVTIDDDGPGLDDASRERVFEPFFRGENAVRQRVPGHGLGLALIRHVAESHHGSAHLDRHDGGGARLQVELPLPEP
jgi:signal transduction histidine kinase